MTCAYKKVLARLAEKHEFEELTDLCNKLGTLWLAYMEAVVENTAAELFRVGRRKLAKMRKETEDDLNYYMSNYAGRDSTGEIKDELWETTQDTAFGLMNRLNALGVDLNRIIGEYPVPDRWGETWHTREEHDRHVWREKWVSSMTIKLTVYWAVLLLWWNENEGYAAVRLERYMRAILGKYITFSQIYLEKRTGWKNTMEKMISDEQKLLEKRGVEFESVDDTPIQPRLAIPVSNEFIENLKNTVDALRPGVKFNY